MPKFNPSEKRGEHILGIHNDQFHSFNQAAYTKLPHGLVALENLESDLIVQKRARLIKDRNYRQPIPYTSFKVLFGGETFYAVYARLTGAAGEERLHDKLSMGFGGHPETLDLISYPDRATYNLVVSLDRTLVREGDEEFIIEQLVDGNWIRRRLIRDVLTQRDPSNVPVPSLPGLSVRIPDQFKPKGIILDDGNDVGLVHVGFHYELDFVADSADWREQFRFSCPEDSCEFVGFFTIEQMREKLDQFENWSQFILTNNQNRLVARWESEDSSVWYSIHETGKIPGEYTFNGNIGLQAGTIAESAEEAITIGEKQIAVAREAGLVTVPLSLVVGLHNIPATPQ